MEVCRPPSSRATSSPRPPFRRALAVLGLRERRRQARHACRLSTTYRHACTKQSPPRPTTILDLSLGGVRLRCQELILPGNCVIVRLPRPKAGSRHDFLVEVIHAFAAPEGGWIMGAAFRTPEPGVAAEGR
jgi:hypothetical protein